MIEGSHCKNNSVRELRLEGRYRVKGKVLEIDPQKDGTCLPGQQGTVPSIPKEGATSGSMELHLKGGRDGSEKIRYGRSQEALDGHLGFFSVGGRGGGFFFSVLFSLCIFLSQIGKSRSSQRENPLGTKAYNN